MSTITVRDPLGPSVPPAAENRVLVANVPWSFYEEFVDRLPESASVRVAYDGKDMEIMTRSQEHGDFAKLLGYLVVELARVLRLSFKELRETTWKRPLLERGIEADDCFCFDPAKLQALSRAKGKRDISLIPNPDLAIEVDISPPLADRSGIYAVLGVTELWIFDGQTVSIERLGADRRYVGVESSQFLKVRAEDLTRWLLAEDTSDDLAWLERLSTWLRNEWKPAS